MMLAALMAGAAAALTAPPGIAPGVFTNEEEVYFDRAAKRPAAPWTGLKIGAGGVAAVDAYGRPATLPSGTLSGAQSRLTLTFADGRTTQLRRGRPVTCWGSVPRAAKKADGSEDWLFERTLKLHDQGGRVAFGGGDTGAAPVVLRLRNVVWPSGPNQPSLVLYVHKPGSPDIAESYSWADPSARRIGINLRWMQASCTIDKVNKDLETR
ncbi:hypothetical protein [Glacieibacterium frigidum]|uniref:Lipoprotein n=1 Tax=Glacieibacterium frigidum TaxID=2593303 RepID=A0A552UIJ7_9SPHN|nr:hypothetical protein [Glacieibacterium frigidum]TRW18045.1 hypothetical protein FMM06_08010 [Glacieibacterium frigidum]